MTGKEAGELAGFILLVSSSIIFLIAIHNYMY